MGTGDRRWYGHKTVKKIKDRKVGDPFSPLCYYRAEESVG